MRKFPIVLVLLLWAIPALGSAANIYVTESGADPGVGWSCHGQTIISRATANGAGAWGSGGTQIGSDTVVHMCGTFTGSFNIQGNGTSGHNIVIQMDSGPTVAKFSGPKANFTSGGIVAIGSHSFLTFDGGTANAGSPGVRGGINSNMELTDTGSFGTNWVSGKDGFLCQSCHDVELKNWGMYNLYVHQPPINVVSVTCDNAAPSSCTATLGGAVQYHNGETCINIANNTLSAVNNSGHQGCVAPGGGQDTGYTITSVSGSTFTFLANQNNINATGTGGQVSDSNEGTDNNGGFYAHNWGINIVIHDSSFGDMADGLNFGGATAGTTMGFQSYRNYFVNIDHAQFYSGCIHDTTDHDNHMGATANWDTVVNQHHHDGEIIPISSAGCTMDDVAIYNNLYDGDWGTHTTSPIFFDIAGTAQMTNVKIYNNVIDGSKSAGSFANGINLIPCYSTGGCTANGPLQVYSNTIVCPGGQGFEVTGKGIDVRDNVEVGCSGYLNNSGGGTFGNVITAMDYNTYGNPIGTGGWQWNGTSATGATFALKFTSWQGIVSAESHSQAVADAKLGNLGYPNSGSAVIGSAINLCNGIISCTGKLTLLASDTSAGNTRIPVARPVGAAPWDGGAYVFAAQALSNYNPTSVAFGNVVNGTTSGNQTVTLCNGTFNGSTCNPSGATLTINSITITGTNSGQFTKVSTACGGTLAAGATCDTVVNFTPNAGGGASFSANLHFNTNAFSSPEDVPLSGKGVDAQNNAGLAPPSSVTVITH